MTTGNCSLHTLTGVKPLYILPTDPLAEEVLIPGFKNADTVDCMVGFFTSDVLASLAPGLAARGKSPDFSDYCSFRELTLRWSNDVSEKPKTANQAGTTSRSAPRADSSRSSGPFEPKSA